MSRTKSHQPGLLIVDHGTRNAMANAMLAQFASRVGSARPSWIVEHAHMELAEPDFDSAIDRLVARGADEILVHLHFLGVGYHVRESIPKLVAMARERHATVSIELTTPIGHDARLVEIVLDRMDAQSDPDRHNSKA
jgi:sirohydrochlorin ferrochelatase